MRKPKSTSILDGLPANQQETLERWLFEENLSYKDAAKRLLDDFNVRCGHSSLVEWYQRIAQRRMLDRIAASRANANLVVTKFRENPADMYQVLLDMVGQAAFEESMEGREKLNPKILFNFTKLVMTGRKQAMEAEGLRLMRDKFELDVATKLLDQALRAKADEINNSDMSHADKIAAMRQEAFKSVDDLQASGKVKIPK